ncbi:CBS domain-containing protein [Candidatus Bathyarchaeota archaeon]|nr:CBS domain-containing protein [Candidatus Bathyarchaeota archaeon]
MSYQVKDYMSKAFSTINLDSSAKDAAVEIKNKEHGFLIVLDKGKPKGIVTLKDLVEKVMASGLDPVVVKVKEIMSSPLMTVDPDEDMLVASKKMHENNIRRLVVERDGIIYGVITSGNIADKCSEYVDKATRDLMRWAAQG